MRYPRSFYSVTSALFTLTFLVVTAGCDLVGQIPVQSLFESEPAPQPIPLWDTAQLAALGGARGHSAEILAIQPAKTQLNQVVTLGADGLVLAWSVNSGTATVAARLPEGPIAGAFGDTHTLVAHAAPTEISVKCLAAGCSNTYKLSRLKVRATAVAFQGDDKSLLIGGADGRVYRWRFLDESEASSIAEREKCLERYIAHQAIVTAVVPHPFGRAFFSADMHGTLLGWLPYTADDYGGKYDQNPFGGQYFSAEATYLPAARAPDRGVVSLAVSEDGNRLAIGAEDGFVEVWEVRGFQLAARAKLHEGRVYSVALNNNGRIVASAGRDGKVVATRTDPDPKFGIAPAATRETLTATRSFPLPDVRKVVFLPDQHIVASTKSGTLAAITVDELPAVPTPSPTAQFNAPVDTDY